MRGLAIVLLVAVLVVAGCGGSDDSPTTGTGGSGATAPLRLGTKNFPEQFLLGELYRQALEAKGFRVELKEDIGSTEIVHQALSDGALDMYPEYIGVLLSEVAGARSRPRDPAAAYRAARAFEQKRGFTLLGATPFSDSNALAVKPDYARRFGISQIADLRNVPGTVRIGAPPEFATRFEGLVGLSQRYGISNARATPMAIGKQYGALDSGKVDAAAVFTTDGQLAGRRYVLLADPAGVFGTQHVAPLISRKALQARPGLRAAADAVSRLLTASAMRRMNRDVVLRGRSPRAVAAEFLRTAKLVD